MNRPTDSDIFGAKAYGNAPRIVNSDFIDPNTVFQEKMDSQYDNYSRTITPVHHQITKPWVNLTSVNEQASFDDSYHHHRKTADLCSTIFYEPGPDCANRAENSRITQRFVPRHAANDQVSCNFGRKETLAREISTMPENTTSFKGNCSNLFGYDDKKERNNVCNRVEKLIPHQMQWDQHDSVKYSEINQSECPEDMESKSVIMTQEEICRVTPHIDSDLMKQKENSSNESNKQTKAQMNKQIASKVATVPPNRVQVIILKGWNSNIMQSLSKCCRLNSTKIISINFQNGAKGTLVLERSKRWEVVTDWLRKDAKLKIRVK